MSRILSRSKSKRTVSVCYLTLLHSERPKLYGVLAVLSAIGLFSGPLSHGLAELHMQPDELDINFEHSLRQVFLNVAYDIRKLIFSRIWMAHGAISFKGK